MHYIYIREITSTMAIIYTHISMTKRHIHTSVSVLSLTVYAFYFNNGFMALRNESRNLIFVCFFFSCHSQRLCYLRTDNNLCICMCFLTSTWICAYAGEIKFTLYLDRSFFAEIRSLQFVHNKSWRLLKSD